MESGYLKNPGLLIGRGFQSDQKIISGTINYQGEWFFFMVVLIRY
jgi:hypothetical protein